MKLSAFLIQLIPFLAFSNFRVINADDIAITGRTSCGRGSVRLSSVSCCSCNFGEKATLTAQVQGCTSSSEVSAVGTGYVTGYSGQSMELFKVDNVDCDDEVSFEFDIPHTSPFIEKIAMGHVNVEFFSDGDQVGCSQVNVMNSNTKKAGSVALGTAGLAAASVGGYFMYKTMTASKVGDFSKMSG